MKNHYKSSKSIILLSIISFLIVLGIFIVLNLENKGDYTITAEGSPYTIVTTSNTISSMVSILIDDAKHITLNTMTNKNIYELNDYVLTDEDYSLIAEADVIYSFGTEPFIDELKSLHPNKTFFSIINDLNDNSSILIKNNKNEDCLYCWINPVSYTIIIGHIGYRLGEYSMGDSTFYLSNDNKYMDTLQQYFDKLNELNNKKSRLLIGENLRYIEDYLGKVTILPADASISEITKVLEENNIEQIITESNNTYNLLKENIDEKYEIFSVEELCKLPEKTSYETIYPEFIKFLTD